MEEISGGILDGNSEDILKKSWEMSHEKSNLVGILGRSPVGILELTPGRFLEKFSREFRKGSLPECRAKKSERNYGRGL